MPRSALRGAFALILLMRPPVLAQTGAGVDSLVTVALATNARVRSLIAQAEAARARVSVSGARPDPMLMVGIQNLPLSANPAMAGPEPMTMRMIGATQTMPYPGKLSLRSRIASAEAEAAGARAGAARREVVRDVLMSYYDLVAARMLLGTIGRQQQLVGAVQPATEARYVSGSATQADILKAQNEAAALVSERNAVLQEERDALARLNALLDRPSTSRIAIDTLLPALAVESATLDSLFAQATTLNPKLREQRATVAAQVARSELARREYLPDFDVTVQYGQRAGLPDMLTAFVSVPLPVQRGRKQSAEATASRADVAVTEADLRDEENAVRASVARLRGEIERDQSNAALIDRTILPQARATFASVSATYQSGRGELLTVLDAMRTLFAVETMRIRTLAQYAKSLAELDAVVGREVAR